MQGDGNAGLCVNDVAKRYGSVEVFTGVSLSAPPGRVTALLGPNGAGKSTLFHILMGLVTADAGTATVDGREILPLPVHRKRDAGIGFLPQDSASFPELSVRENLEALVELLPEPMPPSSAEAAEGSAGRSLGEGRPSSSMGGHRDREERLGQLMARMGLETLADRPYGLLSGGEQRRLEIAKALAVVPPAFRSVLLLDEPFAGLDPHIVEDLAKTIRSLASDGMGVLLADHNVYVTLSFVDYAYVLAGGRILCEGPPDHVKADTAVRALYLGAEFDR